MGRAFISGESFYQWGELLLVGGAVISGEGEGRISRGSQAQGREGVGGGLHQVCVQRVLQTCQGEAQGDPGALSK